MEWDIYKENAAPLARGRNAAALSSALKAQAQGKRVFWKKFQVIVKSKQSRTTFSASLSVLYALFANE
jgi:hypothetical protein